MGLLWLRQLPQCGDWMPASIPPPTEGRSSLINTPVFPPHSFVLPSFAWFYIFFSAGQVLLPTLSWCSVCTSVSEVVFLMYPRREMYSTSTYSSAILLLYKVTFQNTSAHVTTMLKTRNVILHFSQSKVLSKIYMTQTLWLHWLSGLLFNSSLSTSLTSTHISWLAGP